MFICPYHPEEYFYSFSDFMTCNGCADDCESDEIYGCRLVELYARTAYLNNLHRDKEN